MSFETIETKFPHFYRMWIKERRRRFSRTNNKNSKFFSEKYWIDTKWKPLPLIELPSEYVLLHGSLVLWWEIRDDDVKIWNLFAIQVINGFTMGYIHANVYFRLSVVDCGGCVRLQFPKYIQYMHMRCYVCTLMSFTHTGISKWVLRLKYQHIRPHNLFVIREQ